MLPRSQWLRVSAVLWLCCGSLLITANPLWAAPRQTLSPHHVPAAAANLQANGRVAGNTQMEIGIGLPMRNADVFATLLEEIYDPASTNFHHYLTPQQFTEQFGPAPEDYQAVLDFARSNGLTVTRTFPDRTYLVLSGAAADVERTFHLHLLTYPHPNEARNFFAPDVEPTLELSVPVLTVGGLDNFLVPHPMSLHQVASLNSLNATPFGGSGPSGTLIGNDFRNAYVPGVPLTGAGQTVGLLEFDGYFPNDITAYENLAGLPHIPLTNVYVDSYNGAAGSGNSEVALDIEMVASMAPGVSQVVVYEATNDGNVATVNDMMTIIANATNVLQISASWTYPIDATTTNLFQRIAAQGRSFFNASGDSGAYTSVRNPPPPPTDVPYLTSVGGTTLTTTNGGAYVSETVWNWFNTGQGSAASSGGISLTYPIPSWQTGISMTTNKGSTSARNIPDVALTADNLYVAFDNGSAGIFGGTSAASPLWAAFTALVNQQRLASGATNAGFINPAVYAIGKGTNYTNAFHDITTGNNHNNFTTKNFSAVAGYDLCTGWGTPNGAAMIAALAGGAPLITLQPSNEVVAPGGTASFVVGATGTGSLFYQWKFNGTNISQATNSSYTLNNAQVTNQGNYSAVVSNSGGSVMSSNAFLTVNAPPLITGQPQGQTVPQGSNATFMISATGLPLPTFQWQFNGTNIALATGTSFTVTNAKLTDQGNYSALVSNTGGTVASSNAVLTVNAPPSITGEPTSHTINQGNTTIFVVGASGSPTLAYQWFLNGTSVASATASAYVVTNAQFSQSGNYFAIVTNNFGAATSSVAVLTVNAPPSITTQPQGTNVVSGNSAAFSVSATGSTPIGFQWLLNSSSLTDNGHISGSQSASLSISNALAADAGNYQVLVTNAFGSNLSSVATLSISKMTPLVTWANPAPIIYGTALGSNQLNASANQPGNFGYNPPAGTVLSAGTNLLSAVFTPSDTADYNNVTNAVSLTVGPAALSVTASNVTRVYGQPNPAFTAFVSGAANGDVFSASVTSSATVTNLPGNYPIIVTLSDPNNRSGNYVVTTNNGILTITPADPPTITSITPNSGNTNGGDTVTIAGTGFEDGATVNFGAFAAASVIVTNATNIIAVTPAQAAGTVDVVLTNADGQSVVFTNGFTYTNTPPQVPAQLASEPTNQFVVLGGNVTFMVNATGSAPLLYQWLFNSNNVPDATNSSLALSNVQAANAGFYQVMVSNAFGGSTSTVATLNVLGVPVSFLTASGNIQYNNGQFILNVGGLTGQGPVVIQSSSNFTDWLPIYTNASGFGQFQFIDTNAGAPFGWYRAVVPGGP